MATYTLDEKTRKATLTISGDTVITFPTKLDIFGIRSLDGADILASKLKAPTTVEDGVYSTDEGDGDIVIDDGVFTDTLYLKGSGKVAIYGAVRGAQSPFKAGGKGGVRCLGTTTTELYDGSTANPIVIDGVSVTAKRNDIAFYDEGEYMFNGTTWSAFGDLSGLGDLAYKDTADTTYTPEGTVSTPTITITPTTTTVNSITAVGTLPSLEFNENTHMYSLSQGTLPTKGGDTTVMTGASATSTQPTFTGTEATIEVD